MRLGLSLCLLLPLLMGSSCDQGIKFNPDFYIGDSENIQIVPESGPVISCMDEVFDHFACMSEEKIKELRVILATARMPKGKDTLKLQDSMLSKIDSALERMKK